MSDCRPSRLALAGLLVAGCVREAPPGSGAVETTPSSSAAAAATLAPPVVAAPHVLGYPNGAVLVVTAASCRVAALELERTRWTRDFASCGGRLEATVASDSVAYVRTEQELVSITFDGNERWHVALPVVPPTLLVPTALADSRVVIAKGSRAVAALGADGKAAWEFSVPSDETLASAPVGLKTEGVAVVTSRATYSLGSGGELRWRTAHTVTAERP